MAGDVARGGNGEPAEVRPPPPAPASDSDMSMDRSTQQKWLAQWRNAAVAVQGQRRHEVRPGGSATPLSPAPPWNPIFEAALEIQTFCQQGAWQFCFIGGIAVQRWVNRG
jgi:hypothetical protein